MRGFRFRSSRHLWLWSSAKDVTAWCKHRSIKKPHDILDRITFNGMQGTNQAMKSKLQCLRYPIIFSLDGYRSPLHAAAFNDQVECLQLLLSRGGNVDAVDQSGRTPLIMAADNGHAGAVGKLVQVREQERETAYSEKIWLIY